MKTAVIVLFFCLPTPAFGQEPHRFWDKTNVILFSANAAAQGFDFWTTERGLNNGARELNPLGQTRGARIVLKSAGIGAPIGLSYGLHKSGHHRLERLMPIMFAVPSGIAISLNLRF